MTAADTYRLILFASLHLSENKTRARSAYRQFAHFLTGVTNHILTKTQTFGSAVRYKRDDVSEMLSPSSGRADVMIFPLIIMETVSISETSINFYQTASKKKRRLHLRCCDNLTSHFVPGVESFINLPRNYLRYISPSMGVN